MYELTQTMRDRIAEAIRGQSYSYTCESELQEAIAEVLSSCSIPFNREHRITAADRPDFTVEGIAIEIKVEGSLTSVTRQLHRYAQLPGVDEIILVTDKAKHRAVPREMNKKTVNVIYLNPL